MKTRVLEKAQVELEDAVDYYNQDCPGLGYEFADEVFRTMEYRIETEQETDGRWIAEINGLPGVLAYGDTEDEAMTHAEALALRVIAERLETHECRPMPISISLAYA